jgi:hypothetical protein
MNRTEPPDDSPTHERPEPTTMKHSLTLLPALLALLGACHSAPPDPDAPKTEGPWAGEQLQNASMNAAIVAQHTLYSYHFTAGAAELNELGVHDLDVLAAHFQTSTGDLNVRRGEAAQALYEARVRTVLEKLAAAGVTSRSVAVKDGLPGGEGISSERVVEILKGKMSKGTWTTGGMGTSGMNGSLSGGVIP